MNCPVCGKNNFKKVAAETQEEGRKRKMRLLQCLECQLLFAEDYLEDRKHLYGKNYAAWGADALQEEPQIGRAKREAFRCQLKILLKYVQPAGKKFLDVGTGNGYMIESAKEAGFEVWGTEISPSAAAIASKKFPGQIFEGKLESADYPDNFFDVICLTDVLEHLPNPLETVREIGRTLKPDGHLFLISPNTDSIWRMLLRKRWFQYKYEHVCYFNRTSLDYLLENSGLELLEFQNNVKKFSPAYYNAYFQKYSFGGIGKIFRLAFPLLPKQVRNWSFPNPVSGEFLAVAKKIIH